MNPLSSVTSQSLGALPERSGPGRAGRLLGTDERQASLVPAAPAGTPPGQGVIDALQNPDPLLARPVIEPGLLSRQDAPASRRGALMMYALTQGASPGATVGGAGTRLDVRV
jgi:hypothetical protein